MKCCNCGREYDPHNKQAIVHVHVGGSEKKEPIRKLAIDGRNIKFCPYCVRAFVLGYQYDPHSGMTAVEDIVQYET